MVGAGLLANSNRPLLSPVGSALLAPTGPVPALAAGYPTALAATLSVPTQEAPIRKSAAVKRHATNVDTRQVRSELAIIRAMYTFITGEMTGKKHPEFESQDQLFELFIEAMPYYYGISDSTLTNKVNEAKTLLEQA